MTHRGDSSFLKMAFLKKEFDSFISGKRLRMGMYCGMAQSMGTSWYMALWEHFVEACSRFSWKAVGDRTQEKSRRLGSLAVFEGRSHKSHKRGASAGVLKSQQTSQLGWVLLGCNQDHSFFFCWGSSGAQNYSGILFEPALTQYSTRGYFLPFCRCFLFGLPSSASKTLTKNHWMCHRIN